MSRFKPTTLIALDSHSATFCHAVCHQLEQQFPAQRRLVNAQMLVYENGAIAFSSNLDSVGNFCFDLQKNNNSSSQISAVEAKALFSNEQQIKTLEPTLIELLKAGRNQKAIATAQKAGIEVSQQRRIYLLLSAVNPATRGIVTEFASWIRWLFSKRFSTEPYSLEAIILLPGLLTNAGESDYATAYALLKELDASQSSSEMPAFDNHWLIDGCNAQGIQMGSLETNLISYSDAFVGFLTAEPQSIGVLVGAKTIRQKIAAYSTFGYSELFFPVQTVIARLSSQLGLDILTHGFLAKDEPSPENNRRLLLAAKAFVLSDSFIKSYRELEQPDGKTIWQNFNPQTVLKAGMAQEYVDEIKHQHQLFESHSLLNFKSRLESAREKVTSQLFDFLTAKINDWLDAKPTGLTWGLQLLKLLTNPAIAPDSDILGELPKNLITQQRDIIKEFDSQLGVSLETKNSEDLLNQIQELRSQLKKLEDEQAIAKSTSEEGETESEKIVEIRQQLRLAYQAYQQAIEEEEYTARRLRREAIASKRTQLNKGVEEAEKRLINSDNQLEEAKEKLNDILEEKRKFFLKYFCVFPAIAAAFTIFILGIALLFNALPTLLVLLTWFSLIPLISWAIGFTKKFLILNNQEKTAHERIKIYDSSLKTAGITLRNAYNRKSQFEYDLYVDKLRQGILQDLIKETKKKAVALEKRLIELESLKKELNDYYHQQTLGNSATHRSVISLKNINDYYQSQISDPHLPAKIFIAEKVSRSQCWSFPNQEFHTQLKQFSDQQFEELTKLSIGNVLENDLNLIEPGSEDLLLRQLFDSGEPLLQLQQVDTQQTQGRSQDTTIWIGTKDQDQISSQCRQLKPDSTLETAEDSLAIKVLTRCLSFPAYFIGSIEFYLECYDRSSHIEAENKALPDLIPTEFSISGEIREAWQKLLQAIALGIICQSPTGEYTLHKTPLGKKRRQIAEAFATEFSKQKLYHLLCQHLDQVSCDPDLLYQKLSSFVAIAEDLETVEREMLSGLLQDYNPLN